MENDDRYLNAMYTGLGIGVGLILTPVCVVYECLGKLYQHIVEKIHPKKTVNWLDAD